MKLFYITTIIICFSALNLLAQESTLKPDTIYSTRGKKTIIIRGQITDDKTNKGIEFVNIKFLNYPIGCITNVNGEYLLEFDAKLLNDTLLISRIGYDNKYTVATNEKKKINIKLSENSIQLETLEIKSSLSDPVVILTKVIENIPNNYLNGPFSMDVISFKEFYDSTENKLKNLTSRIETYDGNGYRNYKDEGYFRVEESCLFELDENSGIWIPAKKKENILKDIMGFYLKDYVQYRKNNFLNEKNFKYYNFDLVKFNEEQIHIRFFCKKISNKSVPLAYLKSFQGLIRINAENFAILSVDSDYIFDYKKQGTQNMTVNINYDKYEDKYFWKDSFTQASFWNESVITTQHIITGRKKKQLLESVYEMNTKTCKQ